MRKLFLIVLILLVFAPVVEAADGVPAWDWFLTYLSQKAGASAAVGIVLSYIAEYIPKYDALDKKGKRLVFFGVCLTIPLAASLLGSLTAGWGWGWNAVYWPAIVSGFAAFAAGTLAHTRVME